MILLMCNNVHNSWEPATKPVSRLSGDLRCVSAVRRLAANDLPSLIAIYAPTPPGLSQSISVFILVYRGKGRCQELKVGMLVSLCSYALIFRIYSSCGPIQYHSMISSPTIYPNARYPFLLIRIEYLAFCWLTHLNSKLGYRESCSKCSKALSACFWT